MSDGGYVYVLTNEAMPGLVKIGYTRRSARTRGWDMYEKKTGVPLPFIFEFEVWCFDPEAVEASVFSALKPHRVNDYREFFRTDVSHAVITILGEVAKEFDYCIEHIDFTLDEATVPFLAYGLEGLGVKVAPPEIAEALREVSAEELLPALQRVRARRCVAEKDRKADFCCPLGSTENH